MTTCVIFDSTVIVMLKKRQKTTTNKIIICLKIRKSNIKNALYMYTTLPPYTLCYIYTVLFIDHTSRGPLRCKVSILQSFTFVQLLKNNLSQLTKIYTSLKNSINIFLYMNCIRMKKKTEKNVTGKYLNIPSPTVMVLLDCFFEEYCKK